MGIRSKVKNLLDGLIKAIVPEPEPQRPLAPLVKVERQLREQEEARLSQKEKAVQKAKERAKAKAKELGYPDDAIEKMLNNRAVVVGECAWLEQYIEELRQISCHFIESPAQELDADFRKAGAT